jgi:AcrR family transcriptional regulator
MPAQTKPRPYRKKKRAELEEETRLRITEAAVELHRTKGPANTGIVDVARLAGVSRMTVYNHFPTDVDLFTACSTHWATQNPFPDYTQWATIDEPSERLVYALTELYQWYGLKEDMLGKVFRDLPIVPALGQVMDGFWSGYVAALVRTLTHGWRAGRGEVETLDAALRLAIDFNTWRTLRESGLDHDRSAELVARMITCSFPP